MKRFLSNQRGFSMVELVFVLVILGLLAAVAVPKYISMTAEAQKKACLANQKSIENAVLMKYSKYVMQNRDIKLSQVARSLNGNDFADGKVPRCPKGNKRYTISANDQTLRVIVRCPNGHRF